MSIAPPNQRWMEEALALAERAGLQNEVPVGAVLVHDDQIIGSGANRREETKRTTAHAEIEALEDFNRRYQTWRLPVGCSLYVTAEPCLMCTGALLWARLDQLFYGCRDPKDAGLSTQISLIEAGRFDHRFKRVEDGLLAERCSGILSEFFKKKRSKIAPES